MNGKRPGSGRAGAGSDDGRAWRFLLLSALLPLAVLTLFFRLGVPLGCPGRFVYLYSPINLLRLANALPALVIAAVAGLAVWLIDRQARKRWLGLLLVALCAVGLAVWSYLAPPYHRTQHVFNAQSPSHDGAFVREALIVGSVRDYLRDFPQRARTPPAEMRGTRVVSNPPATTLLAVAIERTLRHYPSLVDFAAGPRDSDLPKTGAYEQVRYSNAIGVVFFWVLTALWLVSGVFLYLIGRLHWPPAPAAAFSLCCMFSPMTLLLTPGKDVAQLLTVAVPLYLWLLAVRRGWIWAGFVAGVVFVLACLVSLVHVWVALIVASATIAASVTGHGSGRGPAAVEHRPAGRVLRRALLPAAAGALLAALGLQLLCNVDLTATLRAVAASQAEVTRGPRAMPLAWQMLGLPLFVLFAGPAWWQSVLWPLVSHSAADPPASSDARFGRRLLLICAVVMLGTIGFTNLETPRLWIPFVPLLLLGGAIRITVLRGPSRRKTLVLAVLVGVQISVSALQWSLMDMREAETRLVEQRFFGSAP